MKDELWCMNCGLKPAEKDVFRNQGVEWTLCKNCAENKPFKKIYFNFEAENGHPTNAPYDWDKVGTEKENDEHDKYDCKICQECMRG